MKPKLLLTAIIGATLILGTIIILYTLFNVPHRAEVPSTKPPVLTPYVTITPFNLPADEVVVPAQGEQYTESVSVIRAEEDEYLREMRRLTKLTDTLPYATSLFTFEYNLAEGQYILTVEKSNKTAGLQAFTAFLQEKNIAQRSIPDLVIREK